MSWTLWCMLFAYASLCYCQKNVSITTSKGPVIGLRWNPNPRSGASYDAFLGIPYGKISGRFQPSVPPTNWSTPLVAHSDGPACPQPYNPLFPLQISEDCLYLNVFTPLNASASPGTWPVMAFIHGSGFTTSSSTSAMYGPDFLVPEGIILITMNYRLGAPGFLTLGTPEAPGNLGLLDTQLALRWIKKEIAVFGGDPGQVTLVGQSAGSVMTMFHCLSSVSSGMFQRAIAHSGSALATWGHVSPEEGVRRSLLLARAVGCDTSVNVSLILNCLQQKDINTIANHQNVTLPVENEASGNSFRFVPVIDTAFGRPPFFTDTIENLLKKAATKPKPMIAGFTSEEGLSFLSFDAWRIAEANLKGFNPWSSESNLTERQKIVLGEKIESEYFPKTLDQNKVLDIIHLFTDYSFAYSTIHVIRLLSNSTYGYVFSYDGGWTPMPEYAKQLHVTGAYHGADMSYLFFMGQDLSPCTINKPNLAVRNSIVRLWTNFIKSGIPDSSGSWRTASNGQYLLFDSEISTINASVVEDRHYNFWANLTVSDLNSSAMSTGLLDLLLLLTLSMSYLSLKFTI